MFYELALQGLLNLYFSKLRSSLALLGIIVGTASVVAMISGGELATTEALKQFQSLGTDLLAVSMNDTNESEQNFTGQKNYLALDEALSIAKKSKNIKEIAPYTQSYYMIYYHDQPISAATLGVTHHFANILHLKMQQGRFISILDKYALFCVIGENIYQAIKAVSFDEPLGHQLQINKQLFTIIGVLKNSPENNFIYTDINHAIMIPILTASLFNQNTSINNLLFRLSDKTEIEQIENIIQTSINHYLSHKNISFKSAKELITKMKKQNDILTLFLGLIGSISLIVGGIGVMNMMLVSVMERRTEIGIRLAVGARPADIVLLFLIETILLSLFGGLLGMFFGLLITYILAWWWQWEYLFFAAPLIIGFSISLITGLLSGLYPAYLAARLDPITALKN